MPIEKISILIPWPLRCVSLTRSINVYTFFICFDQWWREVRQTWGMEVPIRTPVNIHVHAAGEAKSFAYPECHGCHGSCPVHTFGTYCVIQNSEHGVYTEQCARWVTEDECRLLEHGTPRTDEFKRTDITLLRTQRAARTQIINVLGARIKKAIHFYCHQCETIIKICFTVYPASWQLR